MTRIAFVAKPCACGCGVTVPQSRRKYAQAQCLKGHHANDKRRKNPEAYAVDLKRRAAVAQKKYKAQYPERVRAAQKRCKSRPGYAVAQADAYLKREYGMSLVDYRDMLAGQGGCCDVCFSDSPGSGRRQFCVDHDHATGRVRGLLCHACNAALGLMRDSPALLEHAAAYLRRKL
jgi:hypothetical protein